MDDLTRAVAEELRKSKALQAAMAFGVPEGANLTCLEAIADDIAPLIEARLREARAEALTAAANAWTQGAWASTPRHKDRVADRMAASQYAGDWLRERAEEVRRRNA